MKKLFKFVIDTDKGVVYNKDGTIKGSKTEKGYYTCRIKDCYGNIYHTIHQVIYAEGAQFPKHLWPIDEKGKRYEVDHIFPVKNGGTDSFSNLRLVSKHDNHNNELTLQNYSNATKGEKNPMYGTHWSEERKETYSLLNSGENASMYGKHHTEEAKKKMSDAKKGKYAGENNPMYGKKREDNIERFSKPVIQLDLDDNFIKEWPSAKSTKKDNFSPTNVSQCCRGEKKTHKGFKWMYKEDYEKNITKSPTTFIE